MKLFVLLLSVAAFVVTALADGVTHLVFEPGPDTEPNGKHVVLIAGDEEYRSEETCPFFGKLLSQKLGYKCTVLFPIHPDGHIDPNYQKNIPGLEALKTADLMVIGTRFRDLPDEQMQHIYDYLAAGKPVFGFRTATHAFRSKSTVGGMDWNKFGKIVLGTGWVSHHGAHKAQGCLGMFEKGAEKHPALIGQRSGQIFSMADVYGVDPEVNPENAEIILRAAVTNNLSSKGTPIAGPKNNPMMPLAWFRKYTVPGGKEGTAFCTTMGASTDFRYRGRETAFFINVINHMLGQPGVDFRKLILKGEKFRPTFYSFISKEYVAERNLKVSDHALGKFRATGLDNPRKDPRWKPKDERTKYPRTKHEQPKEVKPAGAAIQLPLDAAKGESIVMIGNGFAERMMHFGYFETRVQTAHAGREVFFRNLGYPGDTAGLRPRAGNGSQWAFPGAKKYWPQYQSHIGRGHEPMPDEWLTICKADTILACFGFNESFAGPDGVDNFKEEIRAFVDHTQTHAYNGKTAAKLVLVSPVAFEDRTDAYDLPVGTVENANLKLYSEALAEVAKEKGVGFVDLFTPTYDLYGKKRGAKPMTMNGCHLNEQGYAAVAPILMQAVFGKEGKVDESVREAIANKNWYWHNDYRVLNGVHVYGGRFSPFGDYNYPEEVEKVREMTALRDEQIWARAQGSDLEIDDTLTRALTPVPTNYGAKPNYVAPEKSMEKMKLPEGYRVELLASEREFPELANPGQMSYDDRGRLWVSVCPSYPHYRPGDERPNDKLLIFEDKDGNGSLETCTTFADGLHIPLGFEFADGGGVYVAQQPYLVLMEDTDGDDRADKRTVLLDGFDPHDTHHSFSAFHADPSGALLMAEGRFLHSQIETPYGLQRSVDGGIWRFQPQTWRVEKVSSTDYANPWGICYDEHGQTFISDASDGVNWHMLPLSLRTKHARELGKVATLTKIRFRPTAGSDLLYSRHFPEEMQGDFLLGNTIGFLGIMQQHLERDGASFTGDKRQELIRSHDPNVRVSDLEVAPDGSVVFLDWHNVLIGHMQHSARDPYRDHKHGRIYRITREGAPLVAEAKVEGASLDVLFENLKLPEQRSRYRSRRAIAAFPTTEVVAKAEAWASEIDDTTERGKVYLLEALWTTWRQNAISRKLLDRVLGHADPTVRAAGVALVHQARHKLGDSAEVLLAAAQDDDAQVRLSGLSGASWLSWDQNDPRVFMEALSSVIQRDVDKWFKPTLKESFHLLEKDIEQISDTDTALAPLKAELDRRRGRKPAPKPAHIVTAEKLEKGLKESFLRGHAIYHRDAHCATCHQENGQGLGEVYPPLAKSEWVTDSKDRLIKLTLHGLMGPIEVAGKKYNGQVPMTPFGGMLNDKEVADVLNYVRNSWGNKAATVTESEVAKVREETKGQKGLLMADKLLEDHPFE